jgi:hypothetical protein
MRKFERTIRGKRRRDHHDIAIVATKLGLRFADGEDMINHAYITFALKGLRRCVVC